jgi:outer membrane biogenesis lipoprotein LolB
MQKERILLIILALALLAGCGVTSTKHPAQRKAIPWNRFFRSVEPSSVIIY